MVFVQNVQGFLATRLLVTTHIKILLPQPSLILWYVMPIQKRARETLGLYSSKKYSWISISYTLFCVFVMWRMRACYVVSTL